MQGASVEDHKNRINLFNKNVKLCYALKISLLCTKISNPESFCN